MWGQLADHRPRPQTEDRVSAFCNDPSVTTPGGVMGIGYKTSWLAVQDATPEDVCDALGLRQQQYMDWTSGTHAAYRSGVFVIRPVPAWTIAHGRIHLPPEIDLTDPRFPAWLESMSTRLGDLQFFKSDRIGEDHAWARAEGGVLTRAYYYSGTLGDVPLHYGEPTAVERQLGVGQRWLEDGWEDWEDAEWEAWHGAMPSERHVMDIARRWSLCPLDIVDEKVTSRGIHGFP